MKKSIIIATVLSAAVLVGCNATGRVDLINKACSQNTTIAAVTDCWVEKSSEESSISASDKVTVANWAADYKNAVAYGNLTDAQAIKAWNNDVVIPLFQRAEAMDRQRRIAMGRAMQGFSAQQAAAAQRRADIAASYARNRSLQANCTTRVNGDTLQTNCY